MILKNSNLLYLFDFDGTVAGSDDWGGYIHNCKLAFKTLHFNPSMKDIRWSILTARPRIDKLFINLVCGYHLLTPEKIITSDTWTYKFESVEQEAKYKEQIIKEILSNPDNKYCDRGITKVCYIDNNIDLIKFINQNRGDYRYLAMSVSDFINEQYIQLLSGGE
jgi:hypothetical protein